MKTKLLMLLITNLFCIVISCKAQQDSLKLQFVDLMIDIGEFDKGGNKSDLANYVFISSIDGMTNTSDIDNSLFVIGLTRSHFSNYLMLKNKNKYEFIEVKHLDEVLSYIINKFKDDNQPAEKIIKYVEAIIRLYQDNQKAIPWK